MSEEHDVTVEMEKTIRMGTYKLKGSINGKDFEGQRTQGEEEYYGTEKELTDDEKEAISKELKRKYY